jgi:Putative transposase
LHTSPRLVLRSCFFASSRGRKVADEGRADTADYIAGRAWRFLLHVLPRGFVKIRHSGLLANHRRDANLRRTRQALLAPPAHRTSANWLRSLLTHLRADFEKIFCPQTHSPSSATAKPRGGTSLSHVGSPWHRLQFATGTLLGVIF